MIARVLRKSTNIARLILNDFRDFISPPICIACGNDIDADSAFLCGACRKSILGRNTGQGPVCAFCGRPRGVSGSCRLCLEPVGLSLYFWGYYDDILKECITQFKFKGMSALGKEISEMAAGSMETMLAESEFDMIVPIPLYKARRREREYNQAEIIAGILGKSIGIPVVVDLLFRKRQTAQQAKLEESRRWENVRDAFGIQRNCDIEGKSILLVDDIVTTGATVFEASLPLKKLGTGKVEVFSLAYSQ